MEQQKPKIRRRSLCYSLQQTILINIQTDIQFLQDIRQIAQKKQILDLPQFKQKSQITDIQFQQINQKAWKHYQANIFNQTSIVNFNKIDQKNLCGCGCKKGVGQYFPITTNQQNLHFLGPGVILFFFYLRHVILLLVLMLIIYGTFTLVTNFLGSSDDQFQCTNNLFYSYAICYFNQKSTFDKKSQFSIFITFQIWLGLAACIVWQFGIKFLSYLGEEVDQKIDQLLDSASDYTIKIENLPYGDYHEQQLIQYLYDSWGDVESDSNSSLNNHRNSNNDSIALYPDLKLKSIQIVYNTSRCRQLIAQILQQSGKLLKFLKTTADRFSNTIKVNQIQNYKSTKKQLVQKLRELQQMRYKFLNDSQYRKKLATTCALVQFTSTTQQVEFIKIYSSKRNPLQNIFLSTKKLTFKGQDLIISRAPQPSDMNWINCQKKFSYITYIVIWLMTFVIVGIGYTFISVLQTIKIFTSLNTTLVAITLQLINRAIWLALGYLVTYEQNNTKTDAIVSLMKRSVIAQAINVIINPIVSQYVNGKPLYGNTGLAGIILDYHIGMFVTMFLYYPLNPFYLFKRLPLYIKCTRNMIIRKLADVVQKIQNYQQIQKVLEYYEGPQFPVAGGYVYIATAIFHAMFYCHLQPSILLVAVFNVSVFLIIMKYMLFKRCKIPELTDMQVFRFALFAIGFGPMFYGAGSMFFLFLDDNNLTFLQALPSALCLIVWFLGTMNVFSFPDYVVKITLKYINALPDQNQRKNMQAQSISQLIFFNSDFFKNKFWRRRQCYYKSCNTGKLLDFQRQLKDRDLDKEIQGCSVRNYSQSFFKNQIIFDLQQTGDMSPDEQLLFGKKCDFIPIDLVSETQ